MVSKVTVHLRRLAGNRAGEVRYSRWFNNEKVQMEEIISTGLSKTKSRCEGLHILGIQDTSELNYQSHVNRVSGLGRVGNGTDVGFFIHPLLAVDAESQACLGLAGYHSWLRAGVANNRKTLPIEEKESYRWLQVAEQGKQTLNNAAMLTIVADRESDIYELWDRVPDNKTHLLIRVCRDRRLSTGTCLYEWLDKQPVQGCYAFDVTERIGKHRAHMAQMEIRYGEVEIKHPSNNTDKQASPTIKLSVVEVKELAESVPNGDEPVHWRLFTTHPIASVDDAVQCVTWYRLRWNIEQLFRTMKKQGLDVESSQLETGAALMKLAAVAVLAATKVMQLVLARDGQSPRPISDVFDKKEVEILQSLLPTLQGRTKKQMNLYPPIKLAWATWIIARLGGWKGYASEAKPGPITISRGLRQFSMLKAGWQLAKMCA